MYASHYMFSMTRHIFIVQFDASRSHPLANFGVYFLHSFQLDVDPSIHYSGDPETNYMGEEVDALRGRYIRQLTLVLIQHVPAFWKLALSVFDGKFAKVFDLVP